MNPGKSPFPHFALSEDDLGQLQELARALVASGLVEHEEFLRDQREKAEKQLPLVDGTAWKLVHEREKLRAYTSRTTNSTETHGHLAIMLVVGTVAGTMEDVMYGTMNDTAGASLIKTSYVNDTESGVVVLATLEAPTPEEPFRSFVIKYAEIVQQTSIMRTVVKKRDYVFMEMTGIARLPNDGERIGYHLMHSVHFPQTPEIDSAVRANLSIATFSWLKPGISSEVELCVKGVSDPGGSMLRAIASSNMAIALCSTSLNVDCANMKKLAWLVQCSSKKLREPKDEGSRSSLAECVTCNKTPIRGALGDFVNNSRKCHVCFGYVCSSCRIKKRLSFVRAVTSKLVRRELPFCSACILSAVSMSSYAVAQQEILAEACTDCANSDGDGDFFSTSISEDHLRDRSPARK